MRMGWTNVTIVTFLSVFFVISVTSGLNVTDVGYAEGLLSYCPGSLKPAKIKPETLKNLYMAVLSHGGIFTHRWPMFNYYRVKEIVKHPDFDLRKKTYLYVGGYFDSAAFGVGRILGDLYKQMNYNVLILDTMYFTTTYFPHAVRLMRPVGQHVAEMLAALTKLGLNPKNLTVSGISLGGQTMSFVAKNYRRITGQNISTLIALDAGGPCFRHLGPDQRLDPSDGDFVMAIITNSAGFGIGTPVGHASFYVNGGEWQAGEVSFIPCDIPCSHMRAYFVWVAALLNPHRFIGVRCDSVAKAKLGDCFDKPLVTNTLDQNIDRTKPGIYYLPTSNSYPYGLGKAGLKKRSRVPPL